MGTKRFGVACIALLVAACFVSSGSVQADELGNYVDAPRIASSRLYDDGLRPGMVLRTWRVPAEQPGVVTRTTAVQPGMPAPWSE